tara:strand:- start:155 stop:970 length:816 start_codon:yes stop_codon:yes gene_type:complete
MTNSDGRFQFSTSSDTIIIYRPGYDKIISTFKKTRDTIFLNKSVLELNEVTVTNEKTLWQKVKDSIDSNYRLYPYKEKFLLRGVLRYNGEITRIQDIQGKLERRTLLYTKDIEPDDKDFTGHYIINTENNAIERFKLVVEFKNNPFSEDKESRYRTISYDKEISLTKSNKNQKYFIASSKYHAIVEQTNKNNSFTSYYDVSFILTTSENEGDFNVKKNVSASKDLFKINYSYDQRYWNAQNQLLLTEEMLDFIEKVQDPNNEFKVRSNIKN